MSPLNPGSYIRLRREAAGRTRRQAAAVYARSPANAAAAELLLAEIEGNEHIASADALARLARAFPLEPLVYQRLVEGEPVAVCRGCGCSPTDPDLRPLTGPRAWVAPGLCDGCAQRQAAAA